MTYILMFDAVKFEHFQMKNFDISHIFAQNINCGYTLEPPHRVPIIYVIKIGILIDMVISLSQ